MGGSAPAADPNIGIAATKSAETGQKMLQWMQDQAKVTNKWAADDRTRDQTVFKPLQDQFIQDAQDFASPERKQAAALAAGADVQLQSRNANDARIRQSMAMGVDPTSGRFASASAKGATDTALAAAGAGNLSNRAIEDQGRSLKASAINMGSGLAINPATSMGISNGAIQAGGNAAMSGYNQQGNLLNTQYNQQMQSYQANQASMSALGGSIGTVAGLFMSSKEIKENKQPFEALGALEQMPVEKWDYKQGQGDGGTHVGPYAEDFQAATGIGDGKSIDALSMIGVTMGAVRELAQEVKGMKAQILQFAPMGAVADQSGEDEAAEPVQESAAAEMAEPMGAIPMPARKEKPKMKVAA
ncbi:tail fiber domain-containing protein [Cypionkella sp.]|uniref:tail fiber domain-containing protein n=1 Tax=Cypionkella sp. TaxID=2811411 RepID=UPI0027235097|nr:tail fiber domain-containing protein [Cypionkella sp.]MDO8983012.1 tail fiber domain-containing protein [Cypionkella sp.]